MLSIIKGERIIGIFFQYYNHVLQMLLRNSLVTLSSPQLATIYYQTGLLDRKFTIIVFEDKKN